MVNSAFWDGLFFMVIVVNVVMMVILSPFATEAGLGFEEGSIFVVQDTLGIEIVPANFGINLGSAFYLMRVALQMFTFIIITFANALTFTVLLTAMFLNFFGIFGIAWVSISGLIVAMWTFIHLQEIMGVVARFIGAIGELIPL